MDYLIHIFTLVSIWGILALSLNLVVGFTGLLSVSHAAFFGLGAYVTAILLSVFGWNFFLAALAGVAVAALFASGIGLVLSKFKGDYYCLVSLGFNVIVYSIFLNWYNLTGGPLGIPGIPRPALFGFELSENSYFLILALAFLGLVFAACKHIAGSSFGRVLKALREDEKAISVFGYNVLFYKLGVFIIAAGMAALAGSLYASYVTFIDPSTFTLDGSVFILATVILGGLASNRGAVLGAAILVFLPEILRFADFPSQIAAQMQQAVYGLLLVIIMLYRPKGLLGEYKL